MAKPSYLIAFCVGLLALPAAAADVAGSGDHPLVPRYPGSEIVAHAETAFDAYEMLVGAVTASEEPRLGLEGRVTRITYELDQDRSTLEVLRNYEMALTKAGFQPLYACAAKDCGGRRFNHAVVPYDLRFGDRYSDQRYLAMHRQVAGEPQVDAAVYLVKYKTSGGSGPPVIAIQVDVVEAAAMDVGMELVLAEEMQRELDATGHVSLYGILFDEDSDRIDAASEATLEQIAKLLRAAPSLELIVVGHTDDQGSLDYNQSLSSRRAAAVLDALTDRYQVADGRLEAHGVGYLAPVATNADAEGRAQNRRVELVKRRPRY